MQLVFLPPPPCATPFMPPHSCYRLLLPSVLSVFIWVCVLPWIAQVDESLPVVLAHQPRRKLAPFRSSCWVSAGHPWAAGAFSCGLSLSPRAMPGASPAGRVACLLCHTSAPFLSYRLLEPASSRTKQAIHRHPGLVTQWEPGEHVAASTCAHQPTRALPGKSGPQPKSCLPPVLSVYHGL